MIKITLDFDKMLTSLAGNQFGKNVFIKQIEKVVYDEYYEIVFPDRIRNIATSFIQGFFQEFVECFGISGIKDRISIVSTMPNLLNEKLTVKLDGSQGMGRFDLTSNFNPLIEKF